MIESKRYTVTGASGWLGREIIYYLLKSGNFTSLEDFQLFSSTEKILDFGKYGRIKSRNFLDTPLEEFAYSESLIHLAFLTRDKLLPFGFNKFTYINESLTKKAVEYVNEYKPQNIVNVSSGAVFDSNTRELETNYERNPYGYGKLLEEKLLIDTAEKNSVNVVIGRLWGCTGQHMPINRAYAISDFIFSALTLGKINIMSSHRVFRRYLDAGEFLFVLLELAKTHYQIILDSGGIVTELGDLAGLISKNLGGIEIQRFLENGALVDDYFPHGTLFDQYAEDLGIALASLETQVLRTISGHTSQVQSGANSTFKNIRNPDE